MEQIISNYTETDQWVWNTLFSRQVTNLEKFGSLSYLNCLTGMNDVLNDSSIPDFSKVSRWFQSNTGWQIEVVPGLIPVEDFFQLLSQKKFCSSTWLRSPESLDYLEEPDMFHDIFGHIPLLSHPVFSKFIYEFGKLGVKYTGNPEAVEALRRLYWFTIEFGLIKETEIKVYGAGIISSYGETQTSVSTVVKHSEFDIHEILNKPFRTDVMQEEYFVVKNFDDLFNSLKTFEEIFENK